MDKISVIVPIYNVEPYLRQCLDSIVDQTYQNLEIILVDDGSPDNCGAICDEYASRDDRITVIHKENEGVGAARNDGIEASTGEWIMFVDSDDWLEDRAVEVLYQKAVETGCDIVCGTYYLDYPQKQILPPLALDSNRTYVVEQDLESLIGQVLMLNDPGKNIVLTGPCGKIYKAGYIRERCISFPTGLKVGEDGVFNIYAVRYAEKIHVFDFPIYHYRMQSGSVTRRPLSDLAEIYRNLYSECASALKNCLPKDKAQLYIDRKIVKTINDVSFRVVRNAQGFRSAVSQLQNFAQEPACAKAIRDTDIRLVSTLKEKLALWLLKHRMYRTTIFMRIVQKKLFPYK